MTSPAPGINPRGKRQDRPGQGSNWKFGSPFAYLVVILLGFALFRGVFSTEAGFKRVSYSEFKQHLDDHGFQRVVLAQDVIRGYPPQTKGAKTPEQAWIAVRVQGDSDLVPQLERDHVEFESLPSNGWTEVLWVWIVPLGIGLLFWGFLMRRMGSGMGTGGPQGVMSFGKTRARIHAESETGVTFRDVAGIDEAVDELQEIVEFLKTPEKFRRLGGRIPKGVLLVGSPGTGKTLLARAVAGEAGVPFFSLSGSEFVEMFVGVGAARVRDLFAQAQQKAPCIIFIDELDAIGKSRSSSVMGGQDEREQTLNQLLAEMDGFDSKVGLIIIAATNRPEIMDSALLRPGRFDRQVLVDRPDKGGRKKILEVHSQEVRIGPDVDLGEIASRTPGMVGADLANIVNEAALLAARKGRNQVTKADFHEAIERVVAGLERKNRRMNDREKEIVAHHEAGHCVANWMLPHAEQVKKVSIIPRGLAALGYTLQTPLEDRYLMSKDELRDKIAGLMGGRAAEEIFIGAISTGASNDLRQATEIARLMVVEYGMSERVGPWALAESRMMFLPGAPSGPEVRSYSEKTAQVIDGEISTLVAEGLERARRILLENRAKVEALVARLLTTEVVEEDQIRAVLGERAVRPPSDHVHDEEPAGDLGILPI